MPPVERAQARTPAVPQAMPPSPKPARAPSRPSRPSGVPSSPAAPASAPGAASGADAEPGTENAAPGPGLPKYVQVAVRIRGQIAEGALRPGEPVPSGAALSRLTGFSTLTCRKALRVLIADGVLVPGPSRNARPRVAAPGETPAERGLADAARTLSAALAARRRAAGLTQPELAVLADVSVTTVGHAETGRLWQSRTFWTRADHALRAGGDLLRLHDAYRVAAAPPPRQAPPGQAAAAVRRDWAFPAASAAVADALGTARAVPAARHAAGQGTTSPVPQPAAALPPGAAGASCVLIVWADGTVTTVRPPGPPAPAGGSPR